LDQLSQILLFLGLIVGVNVSRETSVLDGSLKTVLNGKVFDAVSGWF
jgi:hypothetical protein